MSRLWRVIVCVGLLAVSLISPAGTSAQGASALEKGCRADPAVEDPGQCIQHLRKARAATATYRDFRVALGDGFSPVGECVSSQDGTMGIHFVNFDRYEQVRVEDPIDISKPEILLYVPDSVKGLRLVALEWVVNVYPVGSSDPYRGLTPPEGEINSAPVLFGGREFNGPMAGHSPLQPWHYDLHVWAWSHNPSGLFAHYNPKEKCTP